MYGRILYKVSVWQVQQLVAEMYEYVLPAAMESGRPKTSGAINENFYKKTDDPFSNHQSVLIFVDDINESITKI
ncbi:MAG: hypothetical protein Kow0098_15290 [Ignavibacteriaceae bacterium]